MIGLIGRGMLGSSFIDVFLDGACVTRRCFVADDGGGWVGLYSEDAEGKRIPHASGGFAREFLFGVVEIRLNHESVDCVAAQRWFAQASAEWEFRHGA